MIQNIKQWALSRYQPPGYEFVDKWFNAQHRLHSLLELMCIFITDAMLHDDQFPTDRDVTLYNISLTVAGNEIKSVLQH